MHATFQFDGPLRLGDRQAVLMPDEVALSSTYESVDAVLLSPARSNSAPIWLRDSDITAVRESVRDVPVHGFWQTALHNNAVDTNSALHVAYTGEDNGIYLECEDGKAVRSGRFASNYIADAPVPLERAVVITPDAVARWRLPSAQARTLEDLTRRRQRQERVAVLQLAGAVGAVLLAAIGVNMTLSSITASRNDAISRAGSAKALEQQKIDQLTKIVNGNRFPDTKTLVLIDRVSSLYYSTRQVVTDLVREDLAGDEIIVQGSLPFRDIGYPVKIAQRQDGAYNIVIPLKLNVEAVK